MKRWFLGGALTALLAAAAGCGSSTPTQTKADTVPIPTGGMNRQGGQGGAIPPPPPPIPGR